jgi:high-affinity Fe2+/Pb2+ permease
MSTAADIDSMLADIDGIIAKNKTLHGDLITREYLKAIYGALLILVMYAWLLSGGLRRLPNKQVFHAKDLLVAMYASVLVRG